jgi:outer membrane protein assembly factor BamB
MKKYLVLVAVALSVGFTACEDEDDVKNVVSIVNESGDNSVAQLDTLYLSAKVDNGISNVNCVWTVDGQEVSTASTYKFSQVKPGDYAVGLTITTTNGEKVQSEMVAKVYGGFGEGTFVLNEGNMTDETGTLVYINPKGELRDSVYYRVNGTLLGNVCQDLFIADGKIYILSQNGAKNGGEGKLVIADAKTLEKEKVYNNELSGLSSPSHLAVIGNDIYIRDSNGVHILNTSTNELTNIDNSKGVAKNRMIVIGDKVFAMNGKNINVLQNKAIVETIAVTGSLSGLAKAYDGNLWASCTSPNQIMKINPSDYSIIETHDLDNGISNGSWGAAPAFSAKEDTLYFSNGGFNLYRHIFKENKTETVANIKESIPDAQMYYNSLGVNPVSGEVIMATLKGYGQDYKINDIAIFDFSKTPALQHDYKGKNSFPAGVYFTYNFE